MKKLFNGFMFVIVNYTIQICFIVSFALNIMALHQINVQSTKIYQVAVQVTEVHHYELQLDTKLSSIGEELSAVQRQVHKLNQLIEKDRADNHRIIKQLNKIQHRLKIMERHKHGHY